MSQKGKQKGKEYTLPLLQRLLFFARIFLLLSVVLAIGSGIYVGISNDPPFSHTLVRLGKPALLKTFISLGLDVNARNPRGDTPLHLAVSWRGPETAEVVRVLLENGADVRARNDEGLTVMHYAVPSGNADMIRFLRDRGLGVNLQDDKGNTPLHEAMLSLPYMQDDYLRLFEALAEGGANVNARNKDGLTPLHLLILGWLVTGPSIDALSLAGKVELFRYEAREQGLFKMLSFLSNRSLRSPVVFSWLVEHGADVDISVPNGDSSFHMVASQGRFVSQIKTLAEGGMDVNVLDSQGLTPLHRAARDNTEINMIEAFLEVGANPTLQDDTGRTAFDYVQDNVVLLKNAAAQGKDVEILLDPTQ